MKLQNSFMALLLMFVSVQSSNAQINWQKGSPPNFKFDAIFDSTAVLPHGIVVDNFNRVWMGSFSSSAPGLIVRNQDGTEASFSPITTVTFGAEITTLDDGGCRGMAKDMNGNILYAKGSTLININAETGAGITKWEGPGSLTKPAVAADGNIYVATVLDVSPIFVLEPIFLSEVTQIELNPVADLARGIEVTADGKNLWTGNLTFGGPVYHYTTTDFVNYPVSDSIFTDADGDSIFRFAITTMNWGPDSTLWFSHETEDPALQSQNGLVIFDFKSQSYSTLFMPEIAGNAFNGPRGVAFSVTEDTAYVASFNGGRVVRFIKGIPPVSVKERQDDLIPVNFELGQNYPNPFNPTTTIPFKLHKNGFVELKVYNLQGQVISTLILQTLSAGKHEATFDASEISSGTYYYQLTVDGVISTKTMIVIK